MEVIEAAAKASGGEVVCTGRVISKELATEGAFDTGKVLIEGDYLLVFWNEYITLEKGGERLATFPDLIPTLDVSTGHPLSSAEIRERHHVAVVGVPKEKLIVGRGVKNRSLYRSIENATGKEIVKYAFSS